MPSCSSGFPGYFSLFSSFFLVAYYAAFSCKKLINSYRFSLRPRHMGLAGNHILAATGSNKPD
jgi:hypothetical protein